MAHYLGSHESVFMSNPKEPFYWCQDYPRSKSWHGMTSQAAYLKLFESANRAQHLAIGESSTTYFQSRVAIKNILAFNPDARIIAMLRDPVQVAHAMHGELRRHFLEDEADFERAWRLQESRARGENLPQNPRMEHQLQYRDLVSYGQHLKRLFDVVPAQQRLVILFDDFVADTRRSYLETLCFLGLPDDGRTEFPQVHPAKVNRSQWLSRLHMDPPNGLRRPMAIARRFYSGLPVSAKSCLSRLLSRRQTRTPLREDFRRELRSEVAEEVDLASNLLGRDLSHWERNDSLSSSVH